MSNLRTQEVTLAYDEAAVIRELCVEVPEGKVASVVGPNGRGKSTLLRSLAPLMKPRGGSIYLDGDAISNLPTREVARRLGILPQSPAAPEEIVTPSLLREVFGVEADVVPDPRTGVPLCIPYGLHHPAGGAVRRSVGEFSPGEARAR